MIQPGADSVRKVSIIPRGRALGVTLSTPEQDRWGYDDDHLTAHIIGALGGGAAEALVSGVTTTGAETDLEHATGIVRQMVGRWGMSDPTEPVSVLPPEDGPPHDRCLGQSGRRRGPGGATDPRRMRSAAEQLPCETLDEADAYAEVRIERVLQS